MLSILLAILIFSIVLGIPALASEEHEDEAAEIRRDQARERRRLSLNEKIEQTNRLQDAFNEKLVQERIEEQKIADLRNSRIAAAKKELTESQEQLELGTT